MKMEWKDCRRLVLSGLLLYLAVHYWSVLAGLADLVIMSETAEFSAGTSGQGDLHRCVRPADLGIHAGLYGQHPHDLL